MGEGAFRDHPGALASAGDRAATDHGRGPIRRPWAGEHFPTRLRELSGHGQAITTFGASFIRPGRRNASTDRVVGSPAPDKLRVSVAVSTSTSPA